MPRVKRGTKRRAKRKKILDRASGYFLTKSKLYRSAKEAVERGLKFAYSGRKQRKRQFRSLWIVRIGAAAKLNGMSYNQFIHGLKLAGFRSTDISILFPDNTGTKDLALERNSKAPEGTAAGAGGGAVVGGILGWLAGVGLLAIPGLGIFVAAGPIMAMLSGIGVGGADRGTSSSDEACAQAGLDAIKSQLD